MSKRETVQLIDLADDADVDAIARELNATPHQVRAAAAIVGRSAGALSRYFATPPAPPPPQGPDFLSRYPLAREMLDHFSRMNSDPSRAPDRWSLIAPLENQVVRAIRQGDIRLDYLPPESDTVTLPPAGDDLYLQALLYWRIRLEARVPDILEAVEAAGLDPTVEEVMGRLVKVAQARQRL